MSSPDTTACRPAICSSVPGSMHLFPRTFFHASVSSFFQTLCLGDSVFVCIHPCLTRQGSLDTRCDSFSAFIAVWFCRSSVRCQRCTTRATSSVTSNLDACRQHVKTSRLNLCNSFQLVLGTGGPAPSLSVVKFFINSNSEATFCHGVPQKISQSVASNVRGDCPARRPKRNPLCGSG